MDVFSLVFVLLFIFSEAPFAAVSVTHENCWSSVLLSGSSVRNRNKGEVDNGKYFSVVFGSSDIPNKRREKPLTSPFLSPTMQNRENVNLLLDNTNI